MTTPSARNNGSQNVAYLRKKTVFGDGETAVITVGTLPKGAIVTRGEVVVLTAFNSATSNTISVGTAAATSGFASVIATGTAGVIAFDDMATSTIVGPLTADTVIQATHVRTGTAATTGEAYICVEYLPNE
jgi:hypothetical protein